MQRDNRTIQGASPGLVFVTFPGVLAIIVACLEKHNAQTAVIIGIYGICLRLRKIIYLFKLHGRLIAPQNSRINFEAGTMNWPEERIAQSIQ
jgi:hypothetical protein